MKYEFIGGDYKDTALIDLLVERHSLRKLESPVLNIPIKKWTGDKHIYVPSLTGGIGQCTVCASDNESDGNHIRTQSENRFLGNGFPIESNIETIAKEYLGICEDRKLWGKELKAAVKEHGHDSLLKAFFDWCESQGVFIGHRPVSSFLKNAGSYVGAASKPTFTNPLLGRVEQKIAYVSDNKIFFTGDYRLKLAILLKEHGETLVVRAFEDFYQDVDDKGINWAARDFLQRAGVMIEVMKQKEANAAAQEALLASTYAQAKTSIEEVEEEEDEL